MPTASRAHALDLQILRQPDDASCGPTCLHAVYRYFGQEMPLDELLAEIPMLEAGGTLAVNLPDPAAAEHGATLEVLLEEGCLARRILARVGARPSREALRGVYAELRDCLREGRLLRGAA